MDPPIGRAIPHVIEQRELTKIEHRGDEPPGEAHPLDAMVLPVVGPIDEATADLHPLIVFHRDANGPPLVLLRSWSRESIYHQTLARLLGPTRPIYSFGPPADPDPSGYPVTVDDWVAHYLDAFERSGVRALAAIGGWSFGGTIALLMAEVLHERGFEIPHVLLLDSRMPVADPRRNPRSLAGRYKRLMIRPRKLKKRILAAARRIAGRSQHGDPSDTVPEERLPPGQTLARAPSGFFVSALGRSVQSSFVRYRPRPTRRPLRLFWTQFSLGYTPGDPTLGWGKWANGELDVEAIPGGHWSMFLDPNVDTVVEKIRGFLDREGAGI